MAVILNISNNLRTPGLDAAPAPQAAAPKVVAQDAVRDSFEIVRSDKAPPAVGSIEALSGAVDGVEKASAFPNEFGRPQKDWLKLGSTPLFRTNKTADDWASAFGAVGSKFAHAELRHHLLGRDGRGLSDAQIAEFVDHRVANDPRFGPRGAFESAEQKDAYREGLTKFLKDRRDHEVLLNGNPVAKVEGLGKLDRTPIHLKKPASGAEREELRAKLDKWQAGERADLEGLRRRVGVDKGDGRFQQRLDELQAARDMYEKIAVGDDGGNVYELPGAVRARYHRHLEQNPGDVYGAYLKIKDDKIGLQAHDAAHNLGGHWGPRARD